MDGFLGKNISIFSVKQIFFSFPGPNLREVTYSWDCVALSIFHGQLWCNRCAYSYSTFSEAKSSRDCILKCYSGDLKTGPQSDEL